LKVYFCDYRNYRCNEFGPDGNLRYLEGGFKGPTPSQIKRSLDYKSDSSQSRGMA